MLSLTITDVEPAELDTPDDPYPNSVLEFLDRSFLAGLVPAEDVITRQGFWRRQFGPEVTGKQGLFDWTFGLILPALCFYFDPFVFRGTGGGALLASYQLPVYFVSGLAIMSLVTWMLWGPRLGPLNALFAGLFALTGMVALLIGVVLLPFSFFGMFYLIGFLGYTPLLTSFVLLRNAVRAYRGC
jgi:hypothetical protein